jgi:hypothetical protein
MSMKICTPSLAGRLALVYSTLSLAAGGLLAENAPNPDRLLQEMSSKLAAARTLRVEAEREIDPALAEHSKAATKSRITIVAQRPNMLVAESAARGDTRHVYADGRHLTFYDPEKKFYATVPFSGSIDALVDELHHVYGFTPPVAEFMRTDVRGDIRQKTQHVSYLGRARYPSGFLGLNGIECHRLGLAGRGADAELWIGDGDLLPHRLIATLKAHPNRPQMKVDFRDWKLGAKVQHEEFAFVPPKGALRIPVKTTAQMTPVTPTGHAKNVQKS